jgi:hypothetical protein
MSKRYTFEAWLVLSTLLFFSIGCKPPSSSGNTEVTAGPTGILVVERTAPTSADQCYLKVTLNQPPNSIDAHVFLTAEPGIRFINTRSAESEAITMTLRAGETREHTFHCELDGANIQLPGEYVVKAVAHDRIGQELLYVAETKLPITLGEDGRPRFSASQESFNAEFSTGFVPGGGNIHYRLDMEEREYPTNGFLLLKVVNQQAGADVTLEASVLEGVQFGDPSAATSTIALLDSQQHTVRVTFGPIAPHGSRIARIPFHIKPGSMDGTYLISVVEDNSMAAWMETAPVMFRVKSDPALTEDSWLAGEQMAQAGPTQPAVILGTRMVAYQPVLPSPATPAPPAPAAPGNAPDMIPTATPTHGAAVIQAMYFTWDEPLTDYYGSCRNVYDQRIAGKLPMTWEAFHTAVVQHNPDLTNTNCMFDPFKHYRLPTAASAEVVR